MHFAFLYINSNQVIFDLYQYFLITTHSIIFYIHFTDFHMLSLVILNFEFLLFAVHKQFNDINYFIHCTIFLCFTIKHQKFTNFFLPIVILKVLIHPFD